MTKVSDFAKMTDQERYDLTIQTLARASVEAAVFTVLTGKLPRPGHNDEVQKVLEESGQKAICNSCVDAFMKAHNNLISIESVTTEVATNDQDQTSH